MASSRACSDPGPTRLAVLLALGVCALAACATLPVAPASVPKPAPASPFSHDVFDRFLSRRVDDHGLVDYAVLARDPADLERYLSDVASRSPLSHPEAFPDDADRLAYWINAYNAWVLRAVLESYPVASVGDVSTPRALFFLPGLARFFVGQRVTLGGDRMSLFWLEHGVIRRGFAEPRVHFALNCASLGCPRLPREAFRPDRLEAQLEREARRFVGEVRNVRIDEAAREIWLSPIFEWYEGDFTSWLEALHPDQPATLASYLAHYTEGELARQLAACRDCALRFVAYDWALNDRDAPCPEQTPATKVFR